VRGLLVVHGTRSHQGELVRTAVPGHLLGGIRWAAMKTRLTAVLRREEGAWKLVHIHVSVTERDREVVELQRRWSSAS
jgi:ketosteroid isomerase-like protein